MSNYREASQKVPLHSLWKPHLRVCDSKLNKKAYAVTKFSSRVIKACVRRLRKDREIFEPWAHVRQTV